MEKQTSNQVTTDDIAFSAYLRMKQFKMLDYEKSRRKSTFTFNVAPKTSDQIKLEFINSDFLAFYNELRNLKKLVA